MFSSGFYEDDMMQHYGMASRRSARPTRRFDEYFRCYPVTFMAGPERENLNYGGKVIMPPSALDKLTRLHISYPMLFELRNGQKQKVTHAGVLEFIAEEGRIYLPYWMMQTLLLEPGDLLEVKSTDLPMGRFIKLKPQSVSFLEISDPKAVLENSLRNFSALTKDDIFSFSYNDQIYEIAIMGVKPENEKGAISCVETDLEVEFEAPVGYVEPSRKPASTPSTRPASSAGLPPHATIHTQGSMAEAIGYAQVAPSSTQRPPSAIERFARSGPGHKLSGKRSKAATPASKPSTPIAGQSTNLPPLTSNAPLTVRKGDGPQPLRLPHGKLFFGYEFVPVKKRENRDAETREGPRFSGMGQSLRGAVVGSEDKKGKGKGKERADDSKEDRSATAKGKGHSLRGEVIEID